MWIICSGDIKGISTESGIHSFHLPEKGKGNHFRMYQVNFITTEDGDDLIVSFAVAGDFSGDVLSLTLLRTPKYEFILDSDERGVSVSWEEDEDESELLRAVERSHVNGDDLSPMRKVLHKMNFDRAIKLTGV